MCINSRAFSSRQTSSGFTLVELIIFIVIVSVAVAGILLVMNFTTANSADPQIRKQALSIAESLMEEASLAPFTYCSAEMTADGSPCTISNGTDTRLSGYDGPVNDIQNNSIPALANYNAKVTIQNAALDSVGSSDALHITVTVTNGSESIQLDGYRTRYMPGTEQ